MNTIHDRQKKLLRITSRE